MEEKLVMFGGHECRVRAERYATTGEAALVLENAWDGEDVAVATFNLPDYPLAPSQVFVKDYGALEGMLDAMVEAEVVRRTGVYVHTPTGSLPVCELLIPPPEAGAASR